MLVIFVLIERHAGSLPAVRSIEDGSHPNMANMVIYENDENNQDFLEGGQAGHSPFWGECTSTVLRNGDESEEQFSEFFCGRRQYRRDPWQTGKQELSRATSEPSAMLYKDRV